MTVKRPDVVERLKARKGLRELVVKTSLSGKLNEKALLPEIEKWVDTVSKATNKGSLVFNRLLIHCLEGGHELPDLTDQTLYLQCLNIGLGRLNKPCSVLKDVWESCFQQFPKIDKNRGDTQTLVYASKNYMTVFKNFLMYTFDNRQKSYLRKWISEQGLDKETIHPIRCAINGWICRTEVPEKARFFVDEQKKILCPPDEGITHTWLGTHMEVVVRYFWRILTYLEQFDDTKRFSIAPISRIKNHFITIDTTVLYEMMKNTKLFEGKKEDFVSLRDDHFNSIFNLSGLCSGTFCHMVETDGVSISVHFRLPKIEPNMTKREIKKADRVIAIDPGRTNLVYGVEEEKDGSFKTYKLTRGQYYSASGMLTARKKSAKWQTDIQEAEKTFMQHSPRTSNVAQWDNFLKDYISVYTPLWEGKTGKKWGRQRFRTYCLKKKTLDRFFRTMYKKGSPKPVIAFGAAKFNPNNKNELSAPTTFVSKTCSKHYHTIMVDEYNTSKVCPCCDARICKVVKKQEDGTVHEVRGLRRCCSTECSQVSYKNRDIVGARNILRCFRSGTCRPHSLSRNPDSKSPKQRCFVLRCRQDEMTVV